jgi:hypothetical protein
MEMSFIKLFINSAFAKTFTMKNRIHKIFYSFGVTLISNYEQSISNH